MAQTSEKNKSGGKMERYRSYIRRVNSAKILAASSKMLFRASILAAILLIVLFTLNYTQLSSAGDLLRRRSLISSSSSGGGDRGGDWKWERQVRQSSTPRRHGGLSVLVTGAAGFVGTHCSLALRKRGDGVVGLDNFNPHLYDPSLKRSREALLAKHSIFVVNGDINDATLLSKLFSISSFTHVLHLAAQAGVRYALKNPQSYVSSNVAGFVNLLEICKSADPQPSIVWASSSSVYGLNTQNPFSELHRTDRPASLYAATKKAGEAIAHAYSHVYGLSLTGLRFFTVYGPWGRPDMAYFSFTKDILDGKPITIFKNSGEYSGEVARDFTFIDDVVKGCLGALDTAGRSGGRVRVYNLGNTSPVTVGKMVATLEGLLGMKAKKRVVQMPSNGDVPFTHANVSLANHAFGYRPTTDLAAGLRKFVKWYVSYYGIKLPKSSNSGVSAAS